MEVTKVRSSKTWKHQLREKGPWVIAGIALFASVFWVYIVAGGARLKEPVASESEEPLHVCDHDAVEAQVGEPKIVHQNYGNSFQEFNLRVAEGGGAHSEGEFHTASAEVTFETIRVKVDYSQIEHDDYTCFPGVDYVKVGTVGGAPGSFLCVNDVITNNCWYSCTDSLDSTKVDYLKNTIVPQAIAWFENTLKVVRVNGSLSLDYSACTDVNSTAQPAEIADTDLYVVVWARPIVKTSTVATATSCQVDQRGRPTAGWIHFRPDKITGTITEKELVGVATHELTHVLGLNSFAWNHPLGDPTKSGFRSHTPPYDYLAATDVLTSYDRTNPVTSTTYGVPKVLKTPAVLNYVRNHFGCSTMVGAPMEDQGGNGTAYSHWEKRTFMNEYMTGTTDKDPVYSNLTLAYLYDTGWYDVNWSYLSESNTLIWGKEKGCSWVQGYCSQWTDAEYFCTSSSAAGCTWDGHGKGGCSLRTDSNIPPQYQNFARVTDRGGYQLQDYCPHIVPYSSYYCWDDSTRSDDTAISNIAIGKEYFGESWGTDALCFSSTLNTESSPYTRTSDFNKLSCHKTGCASSSLFKVQIGSFWYDCTAGASITVLGYEGSVTCPSYNPCGDSVGIDTSWPIVTSIVPSSGNGAGGLTVTITGKRFPSDAKVYVAGVLVTELTVYFAGLDNSTIVFVTPEVPGTTLKSTTAIDVPITVVDSQGRSASAWNFSMTPKALDANQFLLALLEFLRKWAVPLVVGTLALICLVSVYYEWTYIKMEMTPDDDPAY